MRDWWTESFVAAALNRLSLIAELRRTSLCYEYEKIVFIHIIIHIDDRNRNKFKQITNSRKSVCGRSCHAIHLGGKGRYLQAQPVWDARNPIIYKNWTQWNVYLLCSYLIILFFFSIKGMYHRNSIMTRWKSNTFKAYPTFWNNEH